MEHPLKLAFKLRNHPSFNSCHNSWHMHGISVTWNVLSWSGVVLDPKVYIKQSTFLPCPIISWHLDQPLWRSEPKFRLWITEVLWFSYVSIMSPGTEPHFYTVWPPSGIIQPIPITKQHLCVVLVASPGTQYCCADRLIGIRILLLCMAISGEHYQTLQTPEQCLLLRPHWSYDWGVENLHI